MFSLCVQPTKTSIQQISADLQNDDHAVTAGCDITIRILLLTVINTVMAASPGLELTERDRSLEEFRQHFIRPFDSTIMPVWYLTMKLSQ